VFGGLDVRVPLQRTQNPDIDAVKFHWLISLQIASGLSQFAKCDRLNRRVWHI
jgi:hypothetical protein